jgi:hypothetical protein
MRVIYQFPLPILKLDDCPVPSAGGYDYSFVGFKLPLDMQMCSVDWVDMFLISRLFEFIFLCFCMGLAVGK